MNNKLRPLPCFVITYHSEPLALLKRALDSIRINYPDAPLVLICDGVDRQDVENMASRWEAKHVRGEHLKRLSAGLMWWERFFTEFVKTDALYAVKFDADAFLWRPFSELPPDSFDLFGTHVGVYSENFVQGGIQGISRRFAQLCLEREDLLKNPAWGLLENWMQLPGWGTWPWRKIHPPDYFSSDFVIAALCKLLDLKMGHWHEVLSLHPWEHVPNFAYNSKIFAATHPHKKTDHL